MVFKEFSIKVGDNLIQKQNKSATDIKVNDHFEIQH